MVRKILVSQPRPSSDMSPYFEMEKEYGVELVFRPFIKVEGLSSKEFRQQKISILNYTAVVFTSRHAIDNYFKLAADMRLEIPETMKYFCVTETIALYIQKYVQYRKRKVFFGKTGKIDDLLPTMAKHKGEKYLIPLSDVHDDTLDIGGEKYTVELVVQDNEGKTDVTINAFNTTFGTTMNDKVVVGTFGPATAKAAHDAGLKVEVEAPTVQHPSMTSALKDFLANNK